MRKPDGPMVWGIIAGAGCGGAIVYALVLLALMLMTLNVI